MDCVEDDKEDEDEGGDNSNVNKDGGEEEVWGLYSWWLAQVLSRTVWCQPVHC